MQYQNVCLESIGYEIPEEVLSSMEIEMRLRPLYERLRLPEGRLELMTGIRERRLWPREMLPSEKSIESAERAIRISGIDRSEIGALIHGSVCRDYLEPATAARVHHRLDLPEECLICDVSNACLGLLNGIVQIANMIELGQIRAGLVVGTEGSRQLVENTIATLNKEVNLTRKQIKSAVASLTIGSGSCAILLVHRELSHSRNRLCSAAVRAKTEYHDLCHSGRDEAVGDGMKPLMETDSEKLMHHGIQAGVDTFRHFLQMNNWTIADIGKTVCHQVGLTHRKLMLEALEIDPEIDYATVEWLGNTGSVALPLSLAIGLQCGHFSRNDLIAMLGIGSGINSLMLSVLWDQTLVSGNADDQLLESLRSSRSNIIATPG
ncbi:MAG: 3-oxoacyl-ACP synthase III [Pirellulaceae bacterium]|nr:3-oxoacyl-ACP synthase III [Pirellulaceae bacterium]